MAHRGMDWTAAMIGSLTAYWASGMVVTEIAAMMSREFGTPFTANACVGKVHRLGLPARPSPIRRFKNSPPKAAQPASGLAPKVPKIARKRDIESSLTLPMPPRAKPAKVEPRDGVGVLSGEMKNSHCQWPLWDGDLPPLGARRHCGCDVAPGRPYCAGHAAIAFVKVKPRAEGLVLPQQDWTRAKKAPAGKVAA
jgi:GcrA cell cycle regulator